MNTLESLCAAIALILQDFFASVERNIRLLYTNLRLFMFNTAVYLLPAISTKGRLKTKRLLSFIRAVAFPIRSRLRIAAGWGKGCIACVTRMEPVPSIHCICKKIRACACDIFAAEISQTVCNRRESLAISQLYSKNAASRYCRVPVRSKKLIFGEYRFLAGSFYNFIT